MLVPLDFNRVLDFAQQSFLSQGLSVTNKVIIPGLLVYKEILKFEGNSLTVDLKLEISGVLTAEICASHVGCRYHFERKFCLGVPEGENDFRTSISEIGKKVYLSQL